MVARCAGRDRHRRPVRSHEIATPLSETLDPEGARLLDALVGARRWDIDGEGFASTDALFAHLDATQGHLTWTAARLLGAPPEAEPIVRDAAHAAGLAAWFLAVPAYAALGHQPLPDPGPDAVARLANDALQRLARARTKRNSLPRSAAPALYMSALAGPVLARAARTPARVARGTLGSSLATTRLILLATSLTNRW